MILLASARVMLLQVLRDRAALILTFVLPPLIFVILAAIFAGATGTELRLHVGVLDLSASGSGQRLTQALTRQATVRATVESGDEAHLRTMVRDGEVDVGLLIRADLRAGTGSAPAVAPLLVISDPSRAVAAPIVIGQVQRILNEALPDVALSRIIADVERAGKIDTDERAFLERAFADELQHGEQGFSFANLVEQQSATRGALAGGPIAYYAGAVTALFLLFAGMQGAASLLDERQAGIHARLLAGPHGLAAVVFGKFVYLTAQGFVQIVLIYLVAAGVYGVDLRASPLLWAATALFAAAMAASLGLVVNAACSSRQQAQLFANFGVLVVSAVGGSMVPRFLMPPWLQQMSWLTPNAWIIEAFQLSLRSDTRIASMAVPWLILAATALAGLGLAGFLADRQNEG